MPQPDNLFSHELKVDQHINLKVYELIACMFWLFSIIPAFNLTSTICAFVRIINFRPWELVHWQWDTAIKSSQTIQHPKTSHQQT